MDPPKTGAPGGETPEYSAPFASLRKDGLDPTLIVSVSILLLALTLIIARLLKLQWDEAAAKRRTAAILAMAEEDGANERRQANVAGGRRHNVQNRRRVNYGDDFLDQMMDRGGDVDPEDLENDMLHGGVGDEKIGAKKAAKLEAKAAKKAAREQELIEREERKKREQEREEQREKEREREKREEEEEAERVRKEKEEKDRRDLEEYLKLKEQFAVQEEGFDEVEGEEAENLMRTFLDYVKECKVVNIDELAAHFSMKCEDTVNRLQYFLDEGELTGVMDDRGKFIYVTRDEMEAVAKFINQRGRVTISELAEYSNRLVKLES